MVRLQARSAQAFIERPVKVHTVVYTMNQGMWAEGSVLPIFSHIFSMCKNAINAYVYIYGAS